MATHQRASGPERKAHKAGVIGLLYRYRYEGDTARKRLRFIDWLICLPLLELALRQELAELEEQSKMSYITRWVRLVRQEVEARTLLRQMQLRFGLLAPDLAARIQAAEPAQLEVWLDRVLTATGPREVFTSY